MIARRVAERPDTISSNQNIVAQAAEIHGRAQQLGSFLQNVPAALQLRDEFVYWNSLNQQLTSERNLLISRAAELQNQTRQLDAEEIIWKATQQQIEDTTGIEAVAARVQQEIDAIRSARTQSQEQLNQILNMQNQMSRIARDILDSLDQLHEAQERFRGHLLKRDSPPLWAAHALQEGSTTISLMLRQTADRNISTAGEFGRSGPLGILTIPAAYLFFLVCAFRLRRQLAGALAPAMSSETQKILNRPYSLALLGTLTIGLCVTTSAPVSVTLVSYFLWIWVVFRLAPLLFDPNIRTLLYPVLALVLLDLLRIGTPVPPGLNRVLLIGFLSVALIVFGWLTLPAKLRQLNLSVRSAFVFFWATRAGLALLAIALIANICGYVSLSHVLGAGTLLSAFLAAALYCTWRILLVLLDLFLRSRPASILSPELRRAIELWTKRVLLLGAVLLWWTRSELYIFLIHDSFSTAVLNFLAYTIVVGRTSISVASIVSVLLIVGIGYGLSRGVSSLLRSVLIAQLPLQRGLPYAISQVVYYCLLLAMLLAAVSAAGVELNRFTVITGALGVGVGFGLQNIVNNFASGLILLFERPIRIDDVVEVAGLVGTVKRIGARSSTIATGQGAEVIVPNSNLLSNQVINWTLSSSWRRVEIPVGIAYGSDPEAILKLLISVAAENPGVMKDPSPAAYFLGFGESGLNFELRFWSARQDTWFQLKSDVAIGVALALREANIEIPFPQRDFHLRSSDISLFGLTDLSKAPLSNKEILRDGEAAP
ncbi:MAG: Potassium efflux system KefA protein / Small-conductance mechanosensitive channel [Acidobacteriaceae bacterium]|nr:Potassium efflux system KefA protein / Small-conductance mechanosensitive channel [Acidobacteriaceae bacterium]